MQLVLKIALGIILAFAVLAVGQCSATMLIAHQLKQEAKRIQADNDARLAAKKNAAEAEQRRMEEADLRQAREAETQRLERAARDEAFREWYEEPAGCDAYQSDRHMVDCVNHKMKASRTFDELWAKGEVAQPRS